MLDNAHFNMIAVALYMAIVAMCLFAALDWALKAWFRRKQNRLYWRLFDMYYDYRQRG